MWETGPENDRLAGRDVFLLVADVDDRLPFFKKKQFQAVVGVSDVLHRPPVDGESKVSKFRVNVLLHNLAPQLRTTLRIVVSNNVTIII